MQDYNAQLIELLNEKVKRLEHERYELIREIKRLKRENNALRKEAERE